MRRSLIPPLALISSVVFIACKSNVPVRAIDPEPPVRTPPALRDEAPEPWVAAPCSERATAAKAFFESAQPYQYEAFAKTVFPPPREEAQCIDNIEALWVDYPQLTIPETGVCEWKHWGSCGSREPRLAVVGVGDTLIVGPDLPRKPGNSYCAREPSSSHPSCVDHGAIDITGHVRIVRLSTERVADAASPTLRIRKWVPIDNGRKYPIRTEEVVHRFLDPRILAQGDEHKRIVQEGERRLAKRTWITPHIRTMRSVSYRMEWFAGRLSVWCEHAFIVSHGAHAQYFAEAHGLPERVVESATLRIIDRGIFDADGKEVSRDRFFDERQP